MHYVYYVRLWLVCVRAWSLTWIFCCKCLKTSWVADDKAQKAERGGEVLERWWSHSLPRLPLARESGGVLLAPHHNQRQSPRCQRFFTFLGRQLFSCFSNISLQTMLERTPEVSFNPSTGTLNRKAMNYYTVIRWLIHWPLMGGLLYLVQRGGAWTGCSPAQSPPCCTKSNSPPVNGQCTKFIYTVFQKHVTMFLMISWTRTFRLQRILAHSLLRLTGVIFPLHLFSAATLPWEIVKT